MVRGATLEAISIAYLMPIALAHETPALSTVHNCLNMLPDNTHRARRGGEHPRWLLYHEGEECGRRNGEFLRGLLQLAIGSSPMIPLVDRACVVKSGDYSTLVPEVDCEQQK
jgi:hypothetical protein